MRLLLLALGSWTLWKICQENQLLRPVRLPEPLDTEKRRPPAPMF